jgi:hypothetical protein
VPHYITSNPVVAAGHAEVLVAFRRDRLRRDPAEEALWIVELGAAALPITRFSSWRSCVSGRGSIQLAFVMG